MWDQRYSNSEYAYGTQVNDFLKDNYHVIPQGKILSLGEGEGRNAVFLAKAGFSVTAVDSSIVGLIKAKQLAKLNNVSIETIHADLADYDLGENQWDGIISIFCPLPSSIRQRLYSKLHRSLKRGGSFLVEAYTPAQIQRNTGGGKNADVLQTKQTLSSEITQLSMVYLQEQQREVHEGVYHTGLGAVVQAIATRTR
ncbi:class I SAM-dependent methyltransferase [Shewanella sp. 10N.286.54.B9]|uniref:class I SAM-dependent methyltransferase n=1 Tax=Shewanella sp. 10N.286.54.B9 TaxID=3229719 RepID=UPI00354EBD04